MKLNISTDYAIRIILHLANRKQVVSSSKRSKVIQVSPRNLLQIGAKLRDAGLIGTTNGPTGGYSLTKSPEIDDTPELLTLNMAYEHVKNTLEQSLVVNSP